MRVAIITESFPPDVNGVAHCVLRVAELLASSGHHPLVIAPTPPREGGGKKGPREIGGRTAQAPGKGEGRESEEGPAGGSFSFPVVRVPAVPRPGYPSFRLGLPGRRGPRPAAPRTPTGGEPRAPPPRSGQTAPGAP